VAVDADGNLTVSVSVTSSGAAIEDGADAAIKATVKDYTNSNPLTVVLTDTSGDPYVAGVAVGGATAANQVLEIAAVNKINAQILDLDTGGGTANTVGLFLALPASGGPVAGGTTTNPIHIIVDSGSITTGGLTDTQLRATPVPVSGTVTANAGANLNTSALALEAGHLATIDTTTAAGNVLAGAVTEAAPATDTASSGLNGRLQRIAQRLSSLIALLPTALGAGGGLKVDGSGTALPISGTVTATVASTTITGNVATTVADAANVNQGANADVAIAAGAAGTLSAKLRSISRDLVANIVLAAGSSIIGKVGIDQSTPGTTNAVSIAQIGGTTVVTGGVNGSLGTGGNVAHDGVNAGNPDLAGAEAIAFGANPTAVAAADRTKLYANRAGVPFVLSGHPNIITRRDNYTSAQTDTKLITVSTGTKIVVVSCTIASDTATSTKPAVRAGFAASTTPTGAGVYISHPGLSAGSGIREAGAVAGADGDDFIFTCAAPTSGSLDVVTKYFTIES
jgi:hypothetical protein